MSQILLPPSSQEPQPPAEVAPTHDASPPPSYTAEPLKKPSRFWRIVKWPIHQLLKGIYLVGSFVNRHRIISLIALLAIAALVTGSVLTYRALNPAPEQATSGASGAGNLNLPDTPFTVVSGAQVPLSNGVVLWLHGTKTYNGHELWKSMATQYQDLLTQNGSGEDSLQQTMDGFRNAGVKFDQFIVAGSYQFPDGFETFTVEVVVHENNQQGIFTWYFQTDPAGQILSFQDISRS
ncbi:MAG TPA: hypothetical protein VGF38_24430 [Ktedonobacterales bacterium]|jgi:hypothetical protein